MLGLTDPVGDTTGILRRSGINAIAPLDSAPAIADLLRRFVEQPLRRADCVATADAVRQASRHDRAVELASILDSVTR